MTVPQRSIINRIIDTVVDAYYTLVVGRWRWRKAHTITDLANLRADQLARNLATFAPGDGRFRQAETALVALGRAGVVVDAWRVGTNPHGHEHGVTMETRAGVSGFASTEVKDRIDNLLYRAGIKSWGDDAVIHWNIIELWAPGCIEYDRWDGADSARWHGQPVDRMDGTPVSWIGGSVNAREVFRAFPTRRSVQRELRAAWLITIADCTWGDSTLFADLARLLTNDSQTVAQ